MHGSLLNQVFASFQTISDGTATFTQGVPKGLVSIDYATSTVDGSSSAPVSLINIGVVVITDSTYTDNPPLVSLSFSVPLVDGQTFHITNHHHGDAKISVTYTTATSPSRVSSSPHV